MQEWLLNFNQRFPNAQPIHPELAGALSFVLAFLGMLVGSLLSRSPEKRNIPATEVPA